MNCGKQEVCNPDQKLARLVLIRHDLSARNYALQGNRYLPAEPSEATRAEWELIRDLPDDKIPLMEAGHIHSRVTGVAVRQKFGLFDVVYDSGYLRTKQTREGVMEAYSAEERAQMKFRTSPLLRERESGYIFNMTDAEVEKYFPYLERYWKIVGPFYGRPPGGKSLADLRDQVNDFLDLMRRQRPGKKLAVFTHGHVIRVFRCILENWTVDQFLEQYSDGPKNGGVTWYEYNQETQKLELREYNTVY